MRASTRDQLDEHNGDRRDDGRQEGRDDRGGAVTNLIAERPYCLD